MRQGTFAWNELAADRPEIAKEFYAAVLGWTYEAYELPDGAYWVARSDGQPAGGIGGLDTAADPGAEESRWYAFVAVDGVDACAAAATAHGGTVLQAPHDVPGVGRVAVVRDPTGAVLGLMDGDAEGGS